MYVIKNAIKNLARNSKRNIIIACITIAVIMGAVVSITINNAANRIIQDARLDIGSRVDIGIDLFRLNALGLGPEGRVSMTIDAYIGFADSGYLANTIFNVEMMAFSDSVFAIGDTSMGQTPSPDPSMANMMTMKLIGTSHPDNLPDFGTHRHIIDGRMFDGLNEIIISKELAAHNEVSVGDIIVIESVHHPVRTFELEVVGIYSDTTDEFTEWWLAMFGMFAENRRNEILTGFDTIIAAGFETDAGLSMDAIYFLRNPDYLPYFEAEVRGMGLPDIFDVSINQAALDRVTGPLNSLRGTSLTFTVIVLVLGAIVLALISYMAIRERKYEIGVLRAIGMGKLKIALGVFTETVAITAICLIIGLGIGLVTAQPVADMLLANEVEAAETQAAATGGDGGGRVLFAGGEMQTDNPAAGYRPISEININIGPHIIMQIILLAFALAIFSSLIAIIVITKYEPMQILSNKA